MNLLGLGNQGWERHAIDKAYRVDALKLCVMSAGSLTGEGLNQLCPFNISFSSCSKGCTSISMLWAYETIAHLLLSDERLGTFSIASPKACQIQHFESVWVPKVSRAL